MHHGASGTRTGGSRLKDPSSRRSPRLTHPCPSLRSQCWPALTPRARRMVARRLSVPSSHLEARRTTRRVRRRSTGQGPRLMPTQKVSRRPMARGAGTPRHMCRHHRLAGTCPRTPPSGLPSLPCRCAPVHRPSPAQMIRLALWSHRPICRPRTRRLRPAPARVSRSASAFLRPRAKRTPRWSASQPRLPTARRAPPSRSPWRCGAGRVCGGS